MTEEQFDLVFKGKLDLQQIERATQHLKRTRWKVRYLSLSLFLIIMYYLTYNALDNVSDYSPTKLFLLTAGTFVVGGTIGILAGKIFVRKHLKARYQFVLKRGHPGEYGVNDFGIQVKVKEEREFFEWKNFRSAHEFEDMFLLVINPYLYIPFPKSFFETKEEMEAFQTILSRQVNKFKIHSR